MNLSGIFVVVPPQRIQSSIAALDALPGVDVFHHDPATGRIIVTQEAECIDAEVEGLKRIKALPHIILAEMVYHYFEDFEGDDEIVTGIPPELDDLEGLKDVRVPAVLND